MKLSIVTTLYRSSHFIEEFYKRIRFSADKITSDYEIIIVDDGSPDDSLSKAVNIQKSDSHVKVLELSRHYGHHKALMTGLSNAEGDYVFLIDIDLEEAPELLNDFWQEIQRSEDVDVVYGVQETRKGRCFERWSGKIFYWLLGKLIDDIKYPFDTLTARIMKRDYVGKVVQSTESEYDLWSIFEYTGYKTKGLSCRKGYKKTTTYTLSKKVDMALHIIVSTSRKPLQMVFYMGLMISSFSFAYLVYALYVKLFLDVPIGWTSTVALLSLILGITIVSLGIIGIYISVIFLESKKRQIFVRNIYQARSENEQDIHE